VIAGYQRLAHQLLASGFGEIASFYRYRLLQLALIFIFTLRNANKIPPDAAHYWYASEGYIIPSIMQISERGLSCDILSKLNAIEYVGITTVN
jgi:hypothetical protein